MTGSAAASGFAREARGSERLRSNSFHYVAVRDVARLGHTPCPVRSSEERFSPARSLFVRLRDRMRLFTTTTTDFSEEEILRIKDGAGQIYADVSTKIAPDDFAVDLRKLWLSTECVTCSKRPVCGGAWLGSPVDVFSRDTERVEALLRAFRGAVLDIGCGDGRYANALGGSVSAGDAAYLGLDPDAARVALLRSRHPWGEYFTGTLEDYARTKADAEFAHVLLLRSYNHLSDPARTVALACSRLRRGGTLLVVDNVAFGLVRSAEQSARAERGAAQFEHYRNADSAEAEALIARPGLRLIERRDVTPQGSNEWLLHYEKIGNDL